VIYNILLFALLFVAVFLIAYYYTYFITIDAWYFLGNLLLIPIIIISFIFNFNTARAVTKLKPYGEDLVHGEFFLKYYQWRTKRFQKQEEK